MTPIDLGQVNVQRDIPVPLRDGTTLTADVYRPTGPGRRPVLVHRTPYGRELAQTIVLPHPAWFAAKGYIVASVDVRGRYGSPGDFTPYVNEVDDGYDTVEWAAALGGSTGRVGTYGASYAGAGQLQASAARPPALACMVPAMTSDDFYDDWTYEGGAFNLAFVLSWAYAHLAVPDALRRGDHSTATQLQQLASNIAGLYSVTRLADLPLLDREPLAGYLRPWLEHERREPFWDGLEFRKQAAGSGIPSLHIAGWFDGFSPGTIRSHQNHADTDENRHWLLAGPWAHIPWADQVAGRTYAANTRGVVAAALDTFLARHLLDRDGEHPRCQVFDLGTNSWTTPVRWGDTQEVSWYLTSTQGANSRSGDGTLQPEPENRAGSDVYVHQPLYPVPSLGGHACGDESSVPIGSVDQGPVQTRNDVLVYESPPVSTPVSIMGRPRVELFATSTGTGVDWCVRLCVVTGDGRSFNVANGVRRVAAADQPRQPATVEMNPVTVTVQPGQRIMVSIASSDYPHYSVNTGQGHRQLDADRLTAGYTTQVVSHGADAASRLVLPVAH